MFQDRSACGEPLKVVFAICLCVAVLSGTAAQATDDEDEGHDFLFLVEEAYTQEDGEIQLTAALHRSPLDDGGWMLGLSGEYGITDRLQAEVEVPVYLDSPGDEADGIGDLEVELAFAVIEESDTLPQVTISAGVLVPTGDDSEGLGSGGWGYEAGLAVSRRLGRAGFLYGAGSFERVPDGQDEDGDPIEIEEWSFAAGVALAVNDRTTGLIEISSEREREEGGGETEIERETLLSLGFSFELNDYFELGAAYQIGLSDDAPDDGIIFKIKAEW